MRLRETRLDIPDATAQIVCEYHHDVAKRPYMSKCRKNIKYTKTSYIPILFIPQGISNPYVTAEEGVCQSTSKVNIISSVLRVA